MTRKHAVVIAAAMIALTSHQARAQDTNVLDGENLTVPQAIPFVSSSGVLGPPNANSPTPPSCTPPSGFPTANFQCVNINGISTPIYGLTWSAWNSGNQPAGFQPHLGINMANSLNGPNTQPADSIHIVGNNPGIMFESLMPGLGANNHIWDLYQNSAGHLEVNTYNDDYTNVQTLYYFQRNGVFQVGQNGQGTVNVGQLEMTSPFGPIIEFNETGQGADLKQWSLQSLGGVLTGNALADSECCSTPWLYVTRNPSYVVAGMVLPQNVAIGFGNSSSAATPTGSTLTVYDAGRFCCYTPHTQVTVQASISDAGSAHLLRTTLNDGVTETFSVAANGAVAANSVGTTAFSMPTGARAGYVLTSDANGNASWQPPPAPAVAPASAAASVASGGTTPGNTAQSPAAATTTSSGSVPGSGGIAGGSSSGAGSASVGSTGSGTIYNATSAMNGSAITGDGYALGATGITGRSFGFNGAGVSGYNGATGGNAGYFYMDSQSVPSAQTPNPANAVVYAETMTGSATTPGYYGSAGSFVTANPANQSATLYAQSQSGPALQAETTGKSSAVMGEAQVLGGYAAVFKTPAGVCSFGGAPGWSCGMSRIWFDNPSEKVEPQRILRQLAELPISYHTMRGQKNERVRYLGPSAQPFNAAFGFDQDGEMMNSFNAEGVALAAIQGLYQELKKRDEKIQELEARLSGIERAGGGSRQSLAFLGASDSKGLSHSAAGANGEESPPRAKRRRSGARNQKPEIGRLATPGSAF